MPADASLAGPHPSRWIVVRRFTVGAALAMVALTLPGPQALRLTLAVF